jgi:hypothetical protein
MVSASRTCDRPRTFSLSKPGQRSKYFLVDDAVIRVDTRYLQSEMYDWLVISNPPQRPLCLVPESSLLDTSLEGILRIAVKILHLRYVLAKCQKTE